MGADRGRAAVAGSTGRHHRSPPAEECLIEENRAHVPEASVRIVAPQETVTDLTAKPVLGTKERADGDLRGKSFSHIDLNAFSQYDTNIKRNLSEFLTVSQK
jgi:hypothetical protein